MELDYIEQKIACGEMTAAQVFRQMKQHVPSSASPAGYGALTVGDVCVQLAVEDRKDNDLSTELKLYSDCSWVVERESDGEKIAGGGDITSLAAWAMNKQ